MRLQKRISGHYCGGGDQEGAGQRQDSPQAGAGEGVDEFFQDLGCPFMAGGVAEQPCAVQ
jgi:hypothetical protein